MRSTDEQTSQQQQLLVDEKSNLLLSNVSSSANHGSDRREDITTSTLPTPPHSSATGGGGADSGASGTSTTSTAVNTTGPGIGGTSAASNATTTTSSNNSSFAHNSDGTPRAASSGSPLTTTTRPVPNGLERLASFEVCGPACQARRAMESLNNSFFSGSSAMCVSSTPKPPSHNHIQTLVDVSRRQHEQTTVADSVKGQNTWLVAQLQKRLQTAPEEHVIAKVMMVTHDLLAFGAPEFAHALAPVAESYFDPDSLIAHVPHHAEDGHNPLAETIDIYEHTTRFFISFVHTVLQFQLRHRSELNLLDTDATERFLQERNDGLQFWTPHMRDTVTSCMTLTKFVMAANTSVIMPRYNFVFSEIIRRYLLDSKQLYRIAMGSIQCMFHTTTEASKTPVSEIRRNMQGMSQFVILTEKLNDFYDAVRSLPAEVVDSPQQQQQQQGTSSSTTSAASFQTSSGSDSLTDEEERRRQRRWEDATTSILTLVPPRLTTFSPEIHAMMRARLQRYEELENMNIDTLEFVLTSSLSSSLVFVASPSSVPPSPPPQATAANTEPSSSVSPSAPLAALQRNPSAAAREASSVLLETSATFQRETSQRHPSNSMSKNDRSHHHSPATESTHANVESSNRFQVLSEVLGRGGFGVVYKAWDEEEGKHVACKEVKLAEQNRTGIHELLKEYRVLTTLEHPNIVKVLDFMVHKGHGRIFMEWVPSGSVQSVLQETKKGLREPIVRRYIREALQGLAYLHSRGIVHRDVKPGNMLLGSDGSVKLTDFGTSRSAEAAGETVQTGTVVGTVPYLAPECVRGTYSAASDVWAMGCTALHMITGKAPWANEVRDNIGLIFKLGSLSSLPKGVSEHMSDDLRGFITAALTIDRYQRPSVAELLRHPFFTSGV
ncbi:protein kinase, putative [Bodo saltans]|uniref:Protein kinase, putative n=1 Tax=Bodo saltans TaxID=75058 RepID=A0A0S4JRX7_BODSA|nr:protein kinase, putative [Bodo saltans]|eukprot:CUG92971.1 protein kinase, putative [Bodo saltans]